MPLEGVVDALRAIHTALVPGGLLVDTQPVSSQPPVSADGVILGQLDMSEWGGTIAAVDRSFDQVIGELYVVETERHFVVTDSYDSGAEFAENVGNWRGTRIPDLVARRAAAANPPLTLDQDIRLRLMRALPVVARTYRVV